MINTFIIQGLNSFELQSLKRDLRYFRDNTPVKITYRFKKVYIHINENDRYCVLLNLLYNLRSKLITTKRGYKFLSDYFHKPITPLKTNKNENQPHYH